MPDISAQLESKQHQTLTPRLQYAVHLLQMSALEYEQELQDAIGKNPFLQLDEPSSDSTYPADGVSASEPVGDAPVSDIGAQEADADTGPSESWLQMPGTPREAGTDGESAVDRMRAEVGLRPYLRSQANMLPLSERDHTLLCAVIESLDDDGYLRVALEEVGTAADLSPAADACEMNTALRLLQSFDPVGVGARSVSECLLLQTEKIDEALRQVCRDIVSDHLDRLARRDVAGMARLTGHPVAAIEAACAALRRLDPHPGWRFDAPSVQFIKPDVLARKVRGAWTVQLNPAVVPRLSLNQAYATLFRSHREAQHDELATYLREARWTLHNVERRFSTILAVAQAILRRQQGFFEYGALAMKPLSLKEIAQEVGVHESTVCRVTNNKYIATPNGLLELKQFFSRPIALSNYGASSPTAIRGVVQEIIASENPAAPLSDVDVAHKLARQGLTITRRTVTKYRQMLKIPAAPLRRDRAPRGENL